MYYEWNRSKSKYIKLTHFGDHLLLETISSFKNELFCKDMGALKRAVYKKLGELTDLTTESVEGTSLTFEGVDDIHGGDSLPLGVLRVGDSITDDIL